MTNSKANYWVSSGKFALLERLSMLVFGFGNFYFLVRILSKDDFGTWMLFISIATLMEIARTGFFKNPLIRIMGMAEDAKKKEVQNTSFILHFISSLVFASLFYLVSFPLGEMWKIEQFDQLFLIFLISNLVVPIYFHFEYLLVYHLDFRGSLIGNMVRNGSIFLVVLIYFIFSIPLSLIHLAIFYALSVLLGALSNAWFSRKHLIFSIRWSTEICWKLYHYGKYTFGTSIAAVLLRNIDAWMLAWFISPVAVAIYNVAIRISNLVDVPIMALANIMFPKAVEAAAQDGESILKGMYEKSVAAILLFSIPIVVTVIVFSTLIIRIVAGTEYEESSFVLQITIFYSLILPFNKQMGILLDAIGKARINMLFVILAAILNTVLNILLIPVFEITGAALATLSSFVIVVLFNLIYLKTKYDVSMLEIAKYFRMYFLMLIDKVINFQPSKLIK